MLKLSQLITKLEEIKYSLPEGVDPSVFVKCQVAGVDGWLTEKNVQIYNEPDRPTIILIVGGFGA